MTHPTPPFNLQMFCDANIAAHPYLSTPFVIDGYVYACDQKIAVQIPDIGYGFTSLHDNLSESSQRCIKALSEIFTPTIDEQHPGWTHTSVLDPSCQEKCSICQGTGKAYTHICKHCDGEGEFMRGHHYYECKECDGDGHERTQIPQLDSIECDCRACLGSGKNTSLVSIGERLIKRKYFQLLKALPNCQILVVPLNCKTRVESVQFKFDGGRGAVMPYLD